uniref:Carboxylic ester hydrolase n=2 Tax=Clastoptera arizonana TaxID=38151 RepID=A0A1B6ECM7_9HEMI
MDRMCSKKFCTVQEIKSVPLQKIMDLKTVYCFMVHYFLIYNSKIFIEGKRIPNIGNKEVNIHQGTIQGRIRNIDPNILEGKTLYNEGHYVEFLGIPYAQPPVGPLRFKDPQPPKPIQGILYAHSPSSECLQSYGNVSGSEDCLYLNVYTPKLPHIGFTLKPVMVWIHGGAFKSGDGYSNSGPEFLVARDVLLVTFNYRVGIFGFLSLEDDILSGNYGLKDQTQALRWVQENIAQFGGDPKRVTIFGQSAGSACVHYHILSPLSKGNYLIFSLLILWPLFISEILYLL